MRMFSLSCLRERKWTLSFRHQDLQCCKWQKHVKWSKVLDSEHERPLEEQPCLTHRSSIDGLGCGGEVERVEKRVWRNWVMYRNVVKVKTRNTLWLISLCFGVVQRSGYASHSCLLRCGKGWNNKLQFCCVLVVFELYQVGRTRGQSRAAGVGCRALTTLYCASSD